MTAVGAVDRTIYGAYEGEIQALPDPLEGVIPARGLIREKASGWAAEKGKDRKTAEALIRLVQHVTATQFANDLRDCAKEAAKSEVFSRRNVVFVEPGKSQTYCVALVREFLSSSLLLKIGEEAASSLEGSLGVLSEKGISLEGVNDFVFIDDASFTGLQMKANLSGAAKELQKRLPESLLRFHVIVPYMTAQAKELIGGLKEVDVRIYTSATSIHTLQDLPKREVETARKLLGAREDRSLGFLYTDLKVPNRMSFPEVFAGFIPDHPLVYKQPPFILAEEEGGSTGSV